MRILVAVHGYPPDDTDAVARSVRAQVHELASRGHELCVVAGTALPDGGETRLLDREPGLGAKIPVLRLSRSDAHPEHWQKSASSTIPSRFRRALRELAPHVVHVHHWRRLSRDLVACAAAERIPSIVTLHDAYATCLLATRRQPADGLACEADFAPMPCLACAGSVPPATPFVPIDQLFLGFASHRADLHRELVLAREVFAADEALRQVLARHLPDGFRVIPLAPDAAGLEPFLERCVASGPPDAPADVDAWYAPRMRAFAEESWDRGFLEARRAGGADAP